MHNFDYMDDTQEQTEDIINNGDCVNHGPLSLCKIKRSVGDLYQVDCMCKEISYTKVFRKFNEAFDKFLQLRKALISYGYIIYFEKKKKYCISGSIRLGL